MVRGVRALGMEACCTLGMLTRDQAQRLAEAGLTAYNHNLDTVAGILRRDHLAPATYEDRLDTLAHVRDAGITVCCGGIIGMGETRRRPLPACCIRWRTWTRTPRACRSTRWSRSRARRWRDADRRSTRSNWCA